MRVLQAPSPSQNAGFGHCLSLDGHLLLVTSSFSNSAHLYQRQSSNDMGSQWWGLASTLQAPSNLTRGFGAGCGLQGSSVFVSSSASKGVVLQPSPALNLFSIATSAP